MQIEITGKQDRESPWKMAVAGFPGSGKTMFASTAPKPLFVFFQENPRIKSIAGRNIPHVKVVNEQNTKGEITTVQDRLAALAFMLENEGHEKYETLVIDTGDELQQAMKQGRRMKTGGEFSVGDWGWLGDAYREVMLGLIDLPMNVLVLYHLKTAQDGEDGFLVRNLALQGAAGDEAPGWFDVVLALDTFTATEEDGTTVTRRALLSHSSRLYPWVKDHSGALPIRFALSDNFVGDYERVIEVLSAGSDELEDRQVVEEIHTESPEAMEAVGHVPTPDELQAKKQEPKKKEEPEPQQADTSETAETQPDTAPQPEEEPSISTEPTSESTPTPNDISGEGQDLESAADLIKEELGATEVDEAEETSGESPNVAKCEDCGEPIEDNNVLELSQARFRKNLCRNDLRNRIAAAKKGA